MRLGGEQLAILAGAADLVRGPAGRLGNSDALQRAPNRAPARRPGGR